MKRVFYTLLVHFLVCTTICAQKVKVRGEVQDMEHNPVSYCNVAFYLPGDSLLKTGCVADGDGKWELEIPGGTYRMKVSYIGYTTYQQEVILQQNQTLPLITLSESTTELQELVVTRSRKVRTANADIYHLEGSPKTFGRNALEVVLLTAGVSADKKKGLKIYGKEGVRVLVNNQELALQGPELADYIANLRGEDIQTVEVVALADATHAADATGGVIKITLKSRAVNGYDLSAGIKGENYGKTFLGVNPDISLNSKINKLNLYGNLSFSSVGLRETYSETSSYLGTNDGITTRTDADDRTSVRNWFYRLGAVYEIDKKQSAGLDIDGTFLRNKEQIHTPSVIGNSGVLSNYMANYYTPDSIKKFNVSFHYNLRTDDFGSALTVGADYYSSSNHSGEKNRLYSTDADNDLMIETEGTTRYSQHMYTAGINYKWVVTPLFTFDVGGKYNQTKVDNLLDNRIMENGQWGVDINNTDHYIYDEEITASYVNATYKKDKWNLMAGVRYERMVKDMTSRDFPERVEKKTYNDFFPVFSATYHIDAEEGHSLTARYKSGITRPSFDDLIPFSTQQNLYTYAVGNPFLNPSYMYSGGLDLLLFEGLYLGVDYTRTKDAVETTISQRETNSPIVDFKSENIPYVDAYMLMGYIPIPACDWFYAGIELAGGKKQRKFSHMKDKIWQGYVGLETETTIARNWNMELNGSYVNMEFYGNMLLKNCYTVDFALKRSFLHKKLQVAFNAKNIFGREQQLEIRDGAINRNLTMKNAAECRNFALSLRYTFKGKNKVNVDRIQATNAEDRER